MTIDIRRPIESPQQILDRLRAESRDWARENGPLPASADPADVLRAHELAAAGRLQKFVSDAIRFSERRARDLTKQRAGLLRTLPAAKRTVKEAQVRSDAYRNDAELHRQARRAAQAVTAIGQTAGRCAVAAGEWSFTGQELRRLLEADQAKAAGQARLVSRLGRGERVV